MNAISLFVIIIVNIFLTSCSPNGKIPPKAIKGVLDLRDWDFEKNGVINLDGEWEFYWKELPVGDELALPEDKKNYINVPSSWNGQIIKRTTSGGEPFEEILGSEGYATYRLRVLLKDEIDLGLRVPDEATSYELYVNGEILKKYGVVAPSRENSIPGRSIEYIHINKANHELEVVIPISNFHIDQSGLLRSVILGGIDSIYKLRTTNLSRELFISGILFIMGMYHFALFFLRREDNSPLFFGIYCTIVFFRTLIKGELYLNTLFPTLSFANSFKIENLTIYPGLPIFFEFVKILFPLEMNKYIRIILNFLCLIISITVLLFPPLYFTKILTFFHLIILFSIIFVIYTLIKAIKQKREGASTFLFGIILYALTAINDLLYSRIIINTGFYAPVGLVAFIFAQSYLLSSRFSKAFSDTKEAMRMAEEQRQLVETAKEEIERLGRTKDEFLANLSHEIKTPLVSIYGYSELITMEEDLPESIKEYGSEIYSSAGRLNSYMDDVLLVTDLETNLQIDKKPTLLSTLIKNPIYQLESLMKEREIVLHISDISNFKVLCDGVLIERALNNILKNAIVYNKTKGTVKVEVIQTNDKLEINISDTGIGILPEYSDKIFDKFFRIDSSLSYEVSGVGLGLFLAKKILELHGGSISVRSELGQGSEFVIEI